VTGAAGRIGSVFRTVTELLLARWFRVRAHLRVDDARAARLRALGAEVVVGDLLDIMSMHRAIEGCERVCFAMSVAPTYLKAAANVAVVAKHHGVKAFINLSQMTVNEMDMVCSANLVISRLPRECSAFNDTTDIAPLNTTSQASFRVIGKSCSGKL